jgi:sulfofructose kinase
VPPLARRLPMEGASPPPPPPPRVVCVGAAGLDTIFAVPASWQDGPASQKLLPSECRALGAGMASSAAATVARLGARSEIWARGGADAAGEQYLADMRAAGVGVQHVRSVGGGASTTVSSILVSPSGERLVVPYYDPTMDTSADHLPLGSLTPERCSCVLADVRWPEGAAATLRAARAGGVPTVLDADTGPRESLLQLVPLADYAVFSEPGLAIHTGRDDGGDDEGVGWVNEALLAVAAEVAATSAEGQWQRRQRCVAVTLGEHGWRWVLVEQQQEASGAGGSRNRGPVGVGVGVGVSVSAVHSGPAPRVSPVVDTLSAGDVFHGAFAMAIAATATAAAAAAAAVPLSSSGSPTARRRPAAEPGAGAGAATGAAAAVLDIEQVGVGLALDVEGAGLWASAAAALKCTRFGGRAGCPERSELIEYLKGWDVWQDYSDAATAAAERRQQQHGRSSDDDVTTVPVAGRSSYDCAAAPAGYGLCCRGRAHTASRGRL